MLYKKKKVIFISIVSLLIVGIVTVYLMLSSAADQTNQIIFIALMESIVMALTILAVWDIVRRIKKPTLKWIGKGVLSCMILAALFFSVISILITSSIQAPQQKNATVIILGCKVSSQMLMYRVDAAYRYLTENPESVCIASGGQGPDEPYSEALAMKNDLVKKGIAPERIFMEDQSTTTLENIRFSKKIVEENGLSTKVVIATSSIHQYRAQFIARQEGLSSSSAPSLIVQDELGSFWVRESLAVAKTIVFGA